MNAEEILRVRIQ